MVSAEMDQVSDFFNSLGIMSEMECWDWTIAREDPSCVLMEELSLIAYRGQSIRIRTSVNRSDTFYKLIACISWISDNDATKVLTDYIYEFQADTSRGFTVDHLGSIVSDLLPPDLLFDRLEKSPGTDYFRIYAEPPFMAQFEIEDCFESLIDQYKANEIKVSGLVYPTWNAE